MKHCPECGSALLGQSWCNCGWKQRGAKRPASETARCCFDTDGRRCRLTGTGYGGSHFCAWHNHVLEKHLKADDKKLFLEFVAKRGELNPREQRQQELGIKPWLHLWREDPEWLWKQVMAFE